MSSFLYHLLAFWLFINYNNAQAANTECPIKSYQELVKCLEKAASPIKIVEQNLLATKHLEHIAHKLINPELEAESFSKGSTTSETSATLLFTLPLGNKRSANITAAQGEIKKSTAERDEVSQQTRLEIILTLYRLSQIQNEILIEKESTETFAKIISQFEKRPVLTPEQNVSLAVFKMALADHQLKLTSIKSFEEKLYQSLNAISQVKRELIEKNLPTRKLTWPEIKENKTDHDLSPSTRKALAEVEIAESLTVKARAEAWPDLKLGPTLRSTKESSATDTYIGISFNISLPVFNRNSGHISFFEQKKVSASLALEQVKNTESSTRNQLVHKYYKTVQALKGTLSLNTINENHSQIEKQFFKGLVSSALVIEAHRQLIDLEGRRNTAELEAIEALGKILTIDNQFQEEIL